MNFDWYIIEASSYGSNKQYSIIGSDNHLVPTRWQAIIWTNDGYFTDTSLGVNELNSMECLTLPFRAPHGCFIKLYDVTLGFDNMRYIFTDKHVIHKIHQR